MFARRDFDALRLASIARHTNLHSHSTRALIIANLLDLTSYISLDVHMQVFALKGNVRLESSQSNIICSHIARASHLLLSLHSSAVFDKHIF